MTNADSRSRRIAHFIQIGCAFLGLALSLYLLAQHTRLKSGIQGGSSFCSLGKHADCDLVNSSQYSEIAGIPLAGIGALYFFCLLLLVLVSPRQGRVPSESQTWIVRLGVLGVAADTLLLLVQIFLIHSVCLLCLSTYAANLGVLLALPYRLGGPLWQTLQSAFRGDPKGDRLPRKGPTVVLLGISVVVFVGLVALIPSAIRLTSKNYALVDNALEQFFASWPEKKVRVIEPKEGDGVRGNPSAPVRIVEFSDFQCPHCRKAAFTLKAALEPFGEKVFFIFKHFPLHPDCNPVVQYPLHGNACDFARLAACAAKQGKFWELHDYFFLRATEDEVLGGVSAMTPLRNFFTEGEQRRCLSDRRINDSIAESGKLGRSLEVKGTPALYINGKAVAIPLSVENVRRLVELELSLRP